MWDLAVREEDYDAVDAMLKRYAGAPLSMRIVPAYARHDTAAMTRLHEEARGLDARQSQIAARYVATFLEDFAASEDLARLDLQPRRNAGIRLGAQTFLAWLDVARGRWSAASLGFAEAARMDGGGSVRVDRAIAATLPFVDVPRADLESVRRDIESWKTDSGTAVGKPPLAVALRPHLRSYLLGLLSSRLGDDDRAARYAQEIATLPTRPEARELAQALAATVRADVAQRHGRYGEALTLLPPPNGRVPLELVVVKAFANSREFTLEHARYLRAEALLALGRYGEARRWFETSFQGSPAELPYLATVHSRLARIYEHEGDRARADEHRRRFQKIWAGKSP